MQYLRLILAFYIILLSAIPCCAFDSCPEERLVSEQRDSHQPGDQDNCNNCSPFFNCEGCASVAIEIQTTSDSLIPLRFKQEYAFYISPYMEVAHFDFWQPPRADYTS